MPYFTINDKTVFCVPITPENLRIGDNIIFTTESSLRKAITFGRLDYLDANIFWSHKIYRATYLKRYGTYHIGESKSKGVRSLKAKSNPPEAKRGLAFYHLKSARSYLTYKVVAFDKAKGF